MLQLDDDMIDFPHVVGSLFVIHAVLLFTNAAGNFPDER